MITHLSCWCLGLVLVFCAPGAGTWGAECRTALCCDLDGDGTLERLVLDRKANLALSIWRGNARLWQGIPARWKPWKIATGDVDGDGKPEILVGVHKATRFFPKPHHCLFVYGWDGRQAFPRWLGSSLSQPFTDFALANLDEDPGHELLSIEVTRDGRRCARIYSWRGFGFVADRQEGPWRQARVLASQKNRIVLQANGRRVVIQPTGARRAAGQEVVR